MLSIYFDLIVKLRWVPIILIILILVPFPYFDIIPISIPNSIKSNFYFVLGIYIIRSLSLHKVLIIKTF